MVAAILFEPFGQVVLRHEHAARVVVADVEHDQRRPSSSWAMSWTEVAPLNPCMTRKPTPYSSSTGLKHAAHGALLAPHLDALRLLVPEVAAVGSC